MNPAVTPRLYFLDWLRIGAFLILVLYHTGMYYVSWDWHVKSPFARGALEPLMLLSSPWRLGLLFVVSGVASAFLLRRVNSCATFLGSRSARLLVPLLFGMLVVVPVQPYLEVVEKVGYAGSFLDFYALYLSGYGGFCKDGCLILPTWNHLWFVAYLWVYTMLFALAMAAGGARLERGGAWLARFLAGWRALLLPAAVLVLARVTLLTRFPSTHGLVDDFYNHAHYLPLFLLGALLATQDGFWRELERLRRPALLVALACWGYLVLYFGPGGHAIFSEWLEAARIGQRVLFAVCEWCAIVAACGYARRYFDRDAPWRAWLSSAVFPVYLLHQSVIIVLAYAVRPWGLQPVVEGPLIVAATLLLCLGAVALVRRAPALYLPFGLPPVRTQSACRSTQVA